MVTLNKIYTRTGDDGFTSLADGTRRPKYDLRIATYGTIDEVNAAIGLARSHQVDAVLEAILARLQNDLFDLGADLATCDLEKKGVLRITMKQVERLETEIDQLNQELDALKSFILPGGCVISGYLHLARTMMRRAERHMVQLVIENSEEKLNQAARHYVNRASDLLFVAARWANNKGKTDVLWQPGGNC